MQRGELEAKGLTLPLSFIRHARALPSPASCAGIAAAAFCITGTKSLKTSAAHFANLAAGVLLYKHQRSFCCLCL